MNRINARFAQLRAAKQKGFIVYIGAGDPNLETTGKLALAFEKAGELAALEARKSMLTDCLG